jgi:Ca-activated chloride channel homolog
MRGFGAAGFFLAGITSFALLTPGSSPAQARRGQAEPGQLTIIGKDGRAGVLCPLKGTKVNAVVSGFGARVTVVQTFTNPTKGAIEAVYTFPLPNDAAVDRMRMKVGSRIIEGEIKRREEAKTIYEDAKRQGQVASLLDQERPNIFTQSVANIMPGAEVQVEISYAQILKFEDGEFEFNYPMVVGPRYTANAPDPGKITPPVVPPIVRTGSTIDLTVSLDAGAPIQGMESVLHKVNVQRRGDSAATVTLQKKDEIPNKDFILRYKVATDTIQPAFVTHLDQDKGGFYTLILLPPKAPTAQQTAPKEVIFVMDQSGSQDGFPIEKSKELTLKLIKTLRPEDTFNVLGFSNQTYPLWPAARPNTPENLAEAEAFVKKMLAHGGTELEQAITQALTMAPDPRRLRIVTFNTDGFAGDERAILTSIQKHRQNTRVFTFGIGNGVNRYLIDSMSAEGRGDAEYVTLAEGADAAVTRFVKRLETPVLTDVRVQYDGVQVEDMLPQGVPDVFAGKPIVICGRYSQAGAGKVTISGKLGTQPWSKTIDVQYDARADAPALPSLWARRQVDALTRTNYMSRYQDSSQAKNLNEQITKLALDYGLMTEFTSFVAVEKKVVNVGGRQRTVPVPVDLTEGVNYDTTVGRGTLFAGNRPGSFPAASGKFRGPSGGGGGFGGRAATGTTGTTGTTGGAGAAKSGGGNLQGGQGLPPKGIDHISYDPSDNSLVVRDSAGKPLKKDSAEYKAALKKSNFESKVSAKLRSAKGKVEVQVWLKKMDAATIAKLKVLGVKIDDKDAGLKILFGSCDAKKLIELAQLELVHRIEPL